MLIDERGLEQKDDRLSISQIESDAVSEYSNGGQIKRKIHHDYYKPA